MFTTCRVLVSSLYLITQPRSTPVWDMTNFNFIIINVNSNYQCIFHNSIFPIKNILSVDYDYKYHLNHIHVNAHFNKLLAQVSISYRYKKINKTYTKINNFPNREDSCLVFRPFETE